MVLGLDIHALTTTSSSSQPTDPSSSTTTRPFHPPRFVPLSSSHPSSHSSNLPLNNLQQQTVLPEEDQNMVFMDASYLDTGDVGGGGSGLDYDLLDMSPSTFEAFTRVEPLSTTMNPGFDFFLKPKGDIGTANIVAS